MCFEPNEETNISNSKATKINITNVLWNDETQIKFHIAKEKSQSSVHPPNIDLIKKFLIKYKDLKIIIAPRHPLRSNSLIEMFNQKQINSILFNESVNLEEDVLIVNSFGKMTLYYSLSDTRKY